MPKRVLGSPVLRPLRYSVFDGNDNVDDFNAQRFQDFRNYVEWCWRKHPELRSDHGNSRAAKLTREQILFPKLISTFPDICNNTQTEGSMDWKKIVTDLITNNKSNWKRRKRRSSSSSDRDDESCKRSRTTLTTAGHAAASSADYNDMSPVVPCTILANRPFDRMIVVVRDIASRQKRSCMVKDLVQNGGKHKSYTEPSDLAWAKTVKWLRNAFDMAENQEILVSNMAGEPVLDEESFRAYSAEQYWNLSTRLQFQIGKT